MKSAQACDSWPIKANWAFWGRGLKQTGNKTERGADGA